MTNSSTLTHPMSLQLASSPLARLLDLEAELNAVLIERQETVRAG